MHEEKDVLSEGEFDMKEDQVSDYEDFQEALRPNTDLCPLGTLYHDFRDSSGRDPKNLRFSGFASLAKCPKMHLLKQVWRLRLWTLGSALCGHCTIKQILCTEKPFCPMGKNKRSGKMEDYRFKVNTTDFKYCLRCKKIIYLDGFLDNLTKFLKNQ